MTGPHPDNPPAGTEAAAASQAGGHDDALIGLNRLATVARLLSGAAHEVNNALQVISGTVEILESRPDVPASVLDPLARLRTQSNRAAAALAQVLMFIRAPRDVQAPVNLRELAHESLALRDFAVRRARLSGRVEAGTGEPPLVSGNRGDLQQVLLNMIMNAEKALAGTKGTIVVQVARDGDEAVVRVVDDGPGMRPDLAARAFDPFVTTADPFESAGLGLWAARLLAEGHGGTLTLEERPAGASFALRLPAFTPRRS